MTRCTLGEVITAMATPFDDNLNVDYAAAEKLANYLADNGSDAILVAGTTGESPTLTHEEELELLKTVKSAVSGKAKIIMGAGSNSTATAIEMTKKVEAIGVDAVLSVIPYYNKPNQRGQIEHFSKIANSTDLSIVIYNIPGRTGVNMLPDTIAHLAKEFSNIVAVKQSNPDMDQITEIARKTPDDFVIYSGDDSLTLPMLSLGAHGVISVASHLIGKDIKEMITKFKSGDIKGAQAIQYRCYPLFKNLFLTTSPSPLKACLSKWGIISENMRSPMVKVSDEEREKVYKVLDSYQKLSV